MDFAYPPIFSEDPRYYRLAHGSGGRRFLHAVEHAFVAHRDNGKRMFNFSEWLGTTSTVVPIAGHFGLVVRRAHLNREYFILEKDGIPVAGVMNIDELEDYPGGFSFGGEKGGPGGSGAGRR